MPDYQAVLSSHEISKNIADLLEDIDPIQYNGSNRARRVRNVNDYIQNPVALKSELLMSICEQQMGEGQLGAFHKSIIDRCTASVYHDFIKSGGKARQPILSDWRNEIKRQPEREAQELALASELFVEGSLNMFANSEFLVLLNQAATDRAELAKLLNISESQMGYVTNAEAGHGLLRVGGAIVPFANEFPRTGALYQLWNTTPTDK